MKKTAPLQVLVLQLGTLSDCFQSLMALRAAKQLYPQMKINFVCREGCREALVRVPWLEKSYFLPEETVLDKVRTGAISLLEAMPLVARWMSELVQFRWDFVLNWTFSDSSSFLASLIPGRAKLGYERSKDGMLLVRDGWSHYAQAMLKGQVPQNIHKIDILTTQFLTALQLGIGEPENDGAESVTSKGFFELEMGYLENFLDQKYTARKWIGLDLEPGTAPEFWLKFIQKLLEDFPEYNVVLLGEDIVSELSKEILKNLPSQKIDPAKIVSLVGRCDFELWASVISRCNWIVTSRAFTIHLAGVHGTRILCLAKEMRELLEEGPYGNGHFVIFRENPDIDKLDQKWGEWVFLVWAYGVREWYQKENPLLSYLENHKAFEGILERVCIFRSRIRPVSDGGGVVYDAVSENPMRVDDWNATVMGQVARFWYCGWIATIGQEIDRKRLTPDLIEQLRAVASSYEDFIKLIRQAEKTAHMLAIKGSKLKSDKLMKMEDKRTIGELGKKLSVIDETIKNIGQSVPSLKGFSQMTRVLMHHLRGQNLKELSDESIESYRRIIEGLELFKSWLDYTIQLARPKIVKDSNVISLADHRRKRPLEPQL